MSPVADLASYFNIPVFGWVSNEHALDNKSRFTTLVRTLPPLSGLGEMLLGVCREMGWHLVSIISTEGPLSQAVADFFKEKLENNPEFFLVRHFRNVNISLSTTNVRTMMRLLKKQSRIIFLIIPDDLLREYMLAAHDEGMTSGDFQFLFSRQTLASQGFINVLQSESMWRNDEDGRNEDALQAYKNVLYFTYSFILEWTLDHSEAYNASQRLFSNTSLLSQDYERDLYSRFLHDTVYLYALAYNDTVTRNNTPDGLNIFNTATRIQFEGLTGNVNLNKNGDRLPSMLMWDLGEENTFRIVYNLTYYNNATGHLAINVDRNPPGILWGNGKSEDGDGYIPADRPPCGFDNEGCPSDSNLVVIISVLLSIMLAGVLVFFILYRWWKKEQELYRKNWRVKWTQLQFDDGKSSTLNKFHSTAKGMGSHSTLDHSDHSHSAGNVSANSSCGMSRDGGPHQTLYCKTAHLGGTRVAVRMIRKKNIRNDRKLLEEMRLLTKLKHVNLTTFHGVCIEPPNLCVLWEYCYKGSIQDLFRTCKDTDYKIDSMFQFSIAMDVCEGLHYIHSSEMKVHGNLMSSNCLIDNRWTCKLSGFGLSYLLKGEKPDTAKDEQTRYSNLFWTAPEALRVKLKGDPCSPTQTADIYSAAIILKEILCKNEAYAEEMHAKNMTPKDIISKVSAPQGETLFRPTISELPDEAPGVVYSFVRLVHACWQEDPTLRPTARKLLRHMKRLNPFRTSNIMDNMVKMMERYSSRLEELVAERTSQLEDEKRKTDALLYRMLPQKVADDLKLGSRVQAEAFTSVTIYFSDIVSFTQIASESTPMQIVELLNSLYTVFDDVIQENDVYKVETIGDAYMVVSGIPVPNGTRHVSIMADVALSLLEAVYHFVIPHMPATQLRIRIGLNTGPVVAGVVGNIMPRYCLFGDTVNLASRMESHGLPLKIHVSPYTYDVLKNHKEYNVSERGEIEVKGKGKMRTYFLEGKIDPEHDAADHTRDDTTKDSSAFDILCSTEVTHSAGKDNSNQRI
ncbi:atrial natriuretic peptide receptor 1-like [Littorina saxatilis]|uniref:atrial natriuretic peptide receptor 1-like n=1 Tax=Littorina saxatilis TaxID=31220 RepID=UPI0038B65BE1